MIKPRLWARPPARGVRARALPIAGLVLAASLALSGCATEGRPAEAQEESAASETDPILDFYQCLRDNGLDVADPSQQGMIQMTGIDRDDPRTMAVLDECRETSGLSQGGAVTGGAMRGNGTGEMANIEALIDFTACMRENGIDIPDPDPDGTLKMPEEFNLNSPEFRDAVDECRPHLAGGGMRITR